MTTATPSAKRLVGLSVAARLPLAMIGIGLLIRAHDLTGSFGRAGVVAGAYAAALGLGGPLLGRLADRHGQRPVLMGTAVASCTCLVAIATVPAGVPAALLVSLAAVTGAATPPVGACLRARLPELVVDRGAVNGAYAREASLVELTYIAGPPLTLVVANSWSTGAALAVAGLLSLTLTVAFEWQSGGRRHRPVAPLPTSTARPWNAPAMRVLAAVMFTIGVLLGVDEVAVLAAARALHSAAGAAPLFAVWGAGSFAGGLIFARIGGARSAAALVLLLAALTTGHLALVPADGSLVTLGVVLLLAGAAIAPTEATLYAMVGRAAPSGTATEAFAWLATAMAVGNATGTAISGTVTDHSGPRTAFALAGAAGVVALIIATVLRRQFGDEPTTSVSPPVGAGRHGALTVTVVTVTLLTGVATLADRRLMHLSTRNLADLRAGQWWRALSPVLVQPSGWGQLAFNVVGAAVVGAALERRISRWAWSSTYLAGGFGSIAIISAWRPADTGGGSSAAVAALIGAYLVLANARRRSDLGHLDELALLYSVFFAVYLAAGAIAGLTVSIVAGNGAIAGFVLARRAVDRVALSRGSLVVVVAACISLIASRDDHGAGIAIGVCGTGAVLGGRKLVTRVAVHPARRTAAAAVGVAAVCVLLWFAWVHLLGIHLLALRPGAGSAAVGGVDVAVVSAMACLAASAVRRRMVRRSPARGGRRWTVLCVIAAITSTIGPLTLAVGATCTVALISLHLTCAAMIVRLVSTRHRDPSDRALDRQAALGAVT